MMRIFLVFLLVFVTWGGGVASSARAAGANDPTVSSISQIVHAMEGGKTGVASSPTTPTDQLIQSIELQLSVLKKQIQTGKTGVTISVEPGAPSASGKEVVPEFLNVVADAPNLILHKWHQARVDLDLFVEKIQAQMLSPAVQKYVFFEVLKVLFMVIAACVVYWPLRLLLQKPLRAVLAYEKGRHAGLSLKSVYLLLHATLVVLPFCAVLLFLYALLLFIEPISEVRLFLLWLSWTLTILMALRSVIRMVWEQANARWKDQFPGIVRLGWWVQTVVTVIWLSGAILKALEIMGMTGMAMGLSVHIALLLNKILVGVALTVNHRVVTQGLQFVFRMRGMEAPNSAENIFEDSWYGVTIAGLVLLYLAWLTGTVEDLGVFLVRTALSIIVFLVAGYFGARTMEHGQLIQNIIQNKWPAVATKTQPSLQNPPSWVAWGIYALGILGVLEVWRVGLISWATSETFSLIVMKVLIIALIIFSVTIIIKVVDAIVGRKLSQHPETEADGRLFAALMLGRSALRVVLIVVAILMILSEMGVNTGPLLASLGLLGLAITWGSQSVMKDFVSGIVFILDGTTVVGDYIQINGGRLARVEALLLHAIRLRDYDGSLHTVRYSEINLVSNATYEYSYAVFEIGVGYSTDLPYAFQLLRDVANEMRQDPEFADVILEEMDVSGLDEYGESSLNIKARIKTLPKHQFKVRREFLRRLKIVLDAHNIDLPFPQYDVNIKGAEPNLMSLPSLEGKRVPPSGASVAGVTTTESAESAASLRGTPSSNVTTAESAESAPSSRAPVSKPTSPKPKSPKPESPKPGSTS